MRGRLFRKYALAFAAVVCLALVTSGVLDIWFSWQEQRVLLMRVQQREADSAAERITQFLKAIEAQMDWATLVPWDMSTVEQWRFDAVRMLREAPAITGISQLDARGREQFRMSQQTADVIGSRLDRSRDPAFVKVMADKVYYGPVYFLNGSEPYMTLALAGTRPENGVIVARVNLKFIWDVVSRIKVGRHGIAYAVDGQGRLIAHPDISLVLRNIDMSKLPQVEAARPAHGLATGRSVAAVDLKGRPVLSAHAAVPALHWLVFVDLPIDEAYAPLYVSIERSAVLLALGLVLALAVGLFLARRMMVPIRALHEGAARIGRGDLRQRIAIRTGDELEELGGEFNKMASRLGELYATLERKVEGRTRQLENANQAKSRFFAAASHDLRQPLHALGLFVGQLRGRMRGAERERIVGHIEAALGAMNELFNALLDISQLDAGALTPNISAFPAERVLRQVELTFAGSARQKGLGWRVMPCRAWVRSDFILLERILFNLVSNAVRYTRSGRLLVGCRRQGDTLRIEVWDTGRGIALEQRKAIFGEFYRAGAGDGDGESGLGLGLGLAIVDRLCRLLDHPISLRSTEGKGSCFAVSVPLAEPAEHAPPPAAVIAPRVALDGKFVVVIDDDPLVLNGMTGLLRNWGCEVLTASTDGDALAAIAERQRSPDLVISDYHLPGGKSGIEVIDELRRGVAPAVPAFLLSGDTDTEQLQRAKASGLHLLHKPVNPMALRAMFAQLLVERRNAPAEATGARTSGSARACRASPDAARDG